MLDQVLGSSLRSIARFVPNGVLERRFTILIYHRVLSEHDPLLNGEPDAKMFDWQMELLSRHFRPVSLFEALKASQEGRLAPGTVCVTFDDGYADNVEVALPILKRWGIPATFFIATGFLNSGRMWNDSVIETVRRLEGKEIDLSDYGLGVESIATITNRQELIGKMLRALKYLPSEERHSSVESFSQLVNELPSDLMMTQQQLQQLSRSGMEVGAHTVNHPILARVTEEESKQEIIDSVDQLEELIGIRPRYFAYPNGRPTKDYTRRDRQLVERLGLQAAVSTHHGAVGAAADLFQLPRFTPWDRQPERFAARLAFNNIRGDSAVPNSG